MPKGPVPYTNATQQSGRVVISWYMGLGVTTAVVRLIRRVVKLEMFKINDPIVGSLEIQSGYGNPLRPDQMVGAQLSNQERARNAPPPLSKV